jgi:hypothetical protein
MDRCPKSPPLRWIVPIPYAGSSSSNRRGYASSFKEKYSETAVLVRLRLDLVTGHSDVARVFLKSSRLCFLVKRKEIAAPAGRPPIFAFSLVSNIVGKPRTLPPHRLDICRLFSTGSAHSSLARLVAVKPARLVPGPGVVACRP